MALLGARSAVALSSVALAAAGELRGSVGEPRGNQSLQAVPMSLGYCGNTGKMCMSCDVCLGFYHSWGCVGSCANNEACDAGEASPCQPTCKSRVEDLMETGGMSMEDALSQVAKVWWKQCGCLGKSSNFCGRTGEQCTGCDVCLGYYHSFSCVGSCAASEACGMSEVSPCKSTCKDRVEDLMETGGMPMDEALDQIGKTFQNCRCLVRPYCGNTGEKCSSGEVCLGYYKDWGCAGSCATNGACGPGEAAPCKSTCKDRVEDLMEAGSLSRKDAMAQIAKTWSSECSCLA
jgi:hypothetical protein